MKSQIAIAGRKEVGFVCALFETIDNTLVVRLQGDLDHHLATQLREEIDRALQSRGIRRLALDFGKVAFMDSSGIGMVMGRYRLLQSMEGSIAVFGLSPAMDKLFDMSGIKSVIPAYATQEEAIQQLR